MQVRWNFKLKPTQAQQVKMCEWLVTLRKHRNYALRERETGYNTNNRLVDSSVAYVWGSWCEMESKVEYGACCPLTCPILKHGVIPKNLSTAFKTSKGIVKWDSASGIQMKVTTQLRHTSQNFVNIASDVLQQNLTKLDDAFSNFWKHSRGFPRYLRVLNSFQYPPQRVKLSSIKKTYAIVYLPGYR
ncbi:MAG: hypothetical protein HC820_10090 [Hydrococcus sp. RM1_1_31]|nr:hypothetical protein [Hydrococcus sp. RM1_1_31]